MMWLKGLYLNEPTYTNNIYLVLEVINKAQRTLRLEEVLSSKGYARKRLIVLLTIWLFAIS